MVLPNGTALADKLKPNTARDQGYRSMVSALLLPHRRDIVVTEQGNSDDSAANLPSWT
jgi:hypothetical protein